MALLLRRQKGWTRAEHCSDHVVYTLVQYRSLNRGVLLIASRRPNRTDKSTATWLSPTHCSYHVACCSRCSSCLFYRAALVNKRYDRHRVVLMRRLSDGPSLSPVASGLAIPLSQRSLLLLFLFLLVLLFLSFSSSSTPSPSHDMTTASHCYCS